MTKIKRFPTLCGQALAAMRAISVDDALTREARDTQEELRAKANFPGASSLGLWYPWYESRDVTATGGTDGDQGGATIGNAVPEIGVALRDQLTLEQMGARVWGGLTDTVRFPRSNGELHAEWLSETAAATPDDFTFGGLDLSPKRVTAVLPVSLQYLVQQPAGEPFLRTELMGVLATEIQRVVISGSGSSNQPRGIINTAAVPVVAGGTNGAAPTLTHLADLEYTVTGTNKADRGHLGWLCSPKVRRKLRLTAQFSGGGRAIWPDTEAYKLLGHAAGVTGAMPDNLTKGDSAGVCSALAFGEMSEVMIGLWGPGVVVEIITSREGAIAGTVIFVATAYVDGGLRTALAFARMMDALAV